MEAAPEEEEYKLIVEGIQCPPEYTHILTPLEFTELVYAWKEQDPTGSGLIPVDKFKDLCRGLDYTMSREIIETMFVEVDGDGGIDVDDEGMVYFDELARIAVIAKTCPGEEGGKIIFVGEKLYQLRTTPFVELHREAKARNLRVNFRCLDIRESSDVGLPVHVSELLISGIWEEVKDGRIVKKFAVKQYQGIGHSFRQAKYQAAAAGLLTLNKAVLPGANYAPGAIPEEWTSWTNENLLRGVDPLMLVHILKTKSFQPNLNIALLHKIIAWIFFDDFLSRYPRFKKEYLVGHVGEDTLEEDIVRGVPGEGTDHRLPNYFRLWIKSVLDRGIDGAVVADMLEERGMPLKAEHALYASQIRHGEISQTNKFMDFWMACEEGYEDVVRVFLESGVSVDEPSSSRKTSEIMLPFTMAAAQGHIGIMKMLLEDKYKSLDLPHDWMITFVDNKGRTALHYAALRGRTEACEFLISKGAYLYAVDFQGNNSLHLACQANHPTTLFYLADTGLQYCRLICADVLPPCKGKTFNQLAEDIYVLMQKKLLKDNESRRFEKAWLGRGAIAFYNELDDNVKKMIAPPTTNPQIFVDALFRFDPRPETGVYRAFKSKRAGQFAVKKFVPTIPFPRDFAVLLKVVLKAFVLETNNSLRRTLLHIACDANQIRSHEEIIFTLVDHYGVNVLLVDLRGMKPIDLLVQPQPFGDNPSATHEREVVLMGRREATLKALSDEQKAEQRREELARRDGTLAECTRRSQKLAHEAWALTRAASVLWVPGVCSDYKKTKKFAKEWYRFIDPDTMNVFWYRRLRYGEPEAKDYPINYSWTLPEIVRLAFHRSVALNYQRFMYSKHVRWAGYSKWQMMRCTRTNVMFYYSEDKDSIRFTAPKEARWDMILKRATKIRNLGYSEEYIEYKDRDNNLFYHNRLTGDSFWDRPYDAAEVDRKETYCTDYWEPGKRFYQTWYTCDQCNSAWEQYPHEEEGQLGARLKKFCGICIVRCHKYHKGVRLVHGSVVQCQCHHISNVLFCKPCIGMEKNEKQIEMQRLAGLAAVEKDRFETQNKACPPVFALVPAVWPDGSPKKWSGWRLCRRPPLDGSKLKMVGMVFYPSQSGEEEVDSETDSDASDLSAMTGDGDATREEKRKKRKNKEKGPDDEVSLLSDHPDGEHEKNNEPPPAAAAAAVAAADAIAEDEPHALVAVGKKKQANRSEKTENSKLGGFISSSSDEESVVVQVVEKGDSDDEDYGPYQQPEGLPEGWIEVIDPEVPEHLDPGTRVLVSFVDGSDRRYGNIVEAVLGESLYKVMLDWGKDDEAKEQDKMRVKKMKRQIIRRAARAAEKKCLKEGKRFRRKDFEYESDEEEIDPEEGNLLVPRERMEVISRGTFFCHVKLGLCAWTIEQARTNPWPSAPLTLSGIEWNNLYDASISRTNLENMGVLVEEMHHVLTDVVFYVDTELRSRELAAIRLQRAYRQKRCWAQKLGHFWDESAGFHSLAFTLEPSETVLEVQRTMAGWAYLRRRSRDVGNFEDIFGDAWDEFVDNETSEFFYWCEKGNRYLWDKPDIPEVQEEIGDEDVPLEVGMQALYWFPGKMRPELVTVTRIRIDDESGERLHDIISKKPPERRVICIERTFLVIPQLTAEETRMLQMERGWRSHIAAIRANEMRRKLGQKMAFIEEQIAEMTQLMKLRIPIKPEELDDLLDKKNALYRRGVKSKAQMMLEDMDDHEESANQAGMEDKSSSLTILTASNTPAMRAARELRGKQETLDKQIEIDQASNEARAQRVADLLAKFKTESARAIEAMAEDHDLKIEDMDLDEDIQKFVNMAAAAGLSARSVELVMMRTAELRVRLQIQQERRSERHATIQNVKAVEAQRKAQLEEMLGIKECLLTTPRSLIRRTIGRRLHMAMRRQQDRYSICEWGCGMWLPFGRGQIEHQLHYCTKRFMTCTQGCGKKMTEEQWLLPIPSEKEKMKKEKADAKLAKEGKTKKKTFQSPMGPNSPARSPNHTAIVSPFRFKKLSLYGHDVAAKLSVDEEDVLEDDDEEDEGKGLSLREKEDLRLQKEKEPPPVTVQEHHELQECPRRLVHCPLKCTEMVVFEELDYHLTNECVKRPAKPAVCRLGCDAQWGGTVGELIGAEEDRFMHETEECIYRQVRCMWRLPDGAMCAAVMMAKDRDIHRDSHIAGLGITQFVVAGTHKYIVPSNVSRLKIQAWGAGGGSGYFLERKVGYGGGGAFIEVILEVNAFDVLEIVVGTGGQGGNNGIFVEDIDVTAVREEVNIRRKKEMYMTVEQRALEREKMAKDDEISVAASLKSETSVTDAYGNVEAARAVATDKYRAMALGGVPGGGDGYGGHGRWAGGGGGGYTIVSKKGIRGSQALVVADGGGGGGSLNGCPGGGPNGALPGSRIQPRNGGTATVEDGGAPGDCGSVLNSKWVGQKGLPWKGGNGSEYGGGGGGGIFGGGGGGTNPGVAGGGGGGASFIYSTRMKDYIVLIGDGPTPGGMAHDPPAACGLGEWDKPGGPAGQGGKGDVTSSKQGNAGAVRILKPGFY